MGANNVIQMRRGTTTQWTTANPILAAGEIGFDTTVNRTKVGDGTSTWSALTYQATSGVVSQATAPSDTNLLWMDTSTSGSQFVLDDVNDVTLTSAANNDFLIYNSASSQWVNGQGAGYRYIQTIYYTVGGSTPPYYASGGNFTKASWTGLRAVKVTCVGGGGAGGSSIAAAAGSTSIGSGGGSGGISTSFILASSLAASVTVTAGAAGVAGAAGANNGGAGGASSFGTAVVANGGSGGLHRAANASNGFGGAGGAGAIITGAAGDLATPGVNGGWGVTSAALGVSGAGAPSPYGTGGQEKVWAASPSQSAGSAATGYGSGGGGAYTSGAGTSQAGGAGSPGIVIIELYA